MYCSNLKSLVTSAQAISGAVASVVIGVTSASISGCLRMIFCAGLLIPITGDVMAAPRAGHVVRGAVELNVENVGNASCGFVALEQVGQETEWNLPLPPEFAEVKAYEASGAAIQRFEGEHTQWTVDTVGVSGAMGCFSGEADLGPDYGMQRYTVCVIDGGSGPGTRDSFFSRWDMYGEYMPESEVIVGNLEVR